ncbi:MAG: GNAT family N-acetyltransferase [Chloroflexota bacterium]
MSESTVTNNADRKRYEITIDGQVAYLEYIPAGQNIVLSHTEVPVKLEGQGIGGQLVRHVLETLKSNGQQAIVTCPFAISYIRRHPEYLEVVFGYPRK